MVTGMLSGLFSYSCVLYSALAWALTVLTPFLGLSASRLACSGVHMTVSS